MKRALTALAVAVPLTFGLASPANAAPTAPDTHAAAYWNAAHACITETPGLRGPGVVRFPKPTHPDSARWWTAWKGSECLKLANRAEANVRQTDRPTRQARTAARQTPRVKTTRTVTRQAPARTRPAPTARQAKPQRPAVRPAPRKATVQKTTAPTVKRRAQVAAPTPKAPQAYNDVQLPASSLLRTQRPAPDRSNQSVRAPFTGRLTYTPEREPESGRYNKPKAPARTKAQRQATQAAVDAAQYAANSLIAEKAYGKEALKKQEAENRKIAARAAQQPK